MRINLPDQFLDEYWDKPQSARRVVIPSAFALLQAHGQEEAINKLIEEGWSKDFSAWLMPKVDMFRSDLEIEAIPSVPDLGRELATYSAWQSRKKKNYTIAWSCLAGTAVCLLLNVPIVGLCLLAGYMWFMLLVKGRSPWFSLCGLAVLAIIFLPDAAQFGKLVVSPAFLLVSGIIALVYFFIPDTNKQTSPVVPADHEAKLRLIEKIRSIQASEK